MAKRRVRLTFPQELLREPIIYVLGHQFKIVTNILQADISESKAWSVLELEGEEKAIDDAIAWATSRGVRVDTYQTPL
jgi:ABC-type methionine transport system ATPase subunit